MNKQTGRDNSPAACTASDTACATDVTCSNKILILNGPNLNLLGTREPAIYGTSTLAQVEELCRVAAAECGLESDCVQSNHEGVLIDELQAAQGKYVGIVFNPAAYAHTSVALRDAVLAISVPVVEVHISKVESREEFRRVLLIRPVCAGFIAGEGVKGYAHAIRLLAEMLTK